MNVRLLSIAAIIAGTFAYSAQAAEAVAEKPPAASGTAAERKAARVEKRAELKAANKKGEIPKTSEASPAVVATPASGTAAERKAARAAKRAENKELVKKGEIPKTNEAGEVKK